MNILVTGATGYIGGRLVPRLLGKGHLVRCLARNPSRLYGHTWPGVEIVSGDLRDAEATARALDSIEVACYLVHSMAAGQAFQERDRLMALAFGQGYSDMRMKWNEELRDYSNILGVEAGSIFGSKKLMFNTNAQGVIALDTYTTTNGTNP